MEVNLVACSNIILFLEGFEYEFMHKISFGAGFVVADYYIRGGGGGGGVK